MIEGVEETEVVSGGRRLPAALARPGGGSHESGGRGSAGVPGVLVLHELWGLNDDMREVCRRFADAGYAALAPDLLSRRRSRALCMTLLLLGRDRGPAMADVRASLSALAAVEGVDGERLGIIGFCMGGGFALAAGTEGVARVVSVNYGEVPARASDLEDACPVVASYGARDRLFGTHGRRLEAHLRELGIEHDVHTYDDAGHSFMTRGGGPAVVAKLPNPMHVGFHPDAAEDAWRRTFAFFDRQLRKG